MRIAEGQPAPDFERVDTSGATVRLADYRGGRVYLAFHRFAACPFCNLRMHRLIEAHPSWAATGLSVVTFFQSPRALIADGVGAQRPPFPIVPDPEMEVYARYGVERSTTAMLGAGLRRMGDFATSIAKGFAPRRVDGDPRLVPASFLIDEDGVVRVAYYGRDIGDHLPLGAIEAFATQGAWAAQ